VEEWPMDDVPDEPVASDDNNSEGDGQSLVQKKSHHHHSVSFAQVLKGKRIKKHNGSTKGSDKYILHVNNNP
jgi:hypothetical protein